MTTVVDKVKDNNMVSQAELNDQFNLALEAVDDIVLKNYISNLVEYDVLPLDDNEIKNNIINNVRLYKISEMVYEKDENSTYKFASVYNSLLGTGCSIFVVIDSNGDKTEFYMGVRSLNSNRTTASLGNTLKNAMKGQFPGIKTVEYTCDDKDEHNINSVINKIKTNSISIVTCVADQKNENDYQNQSFIQGLEKLALTMQGQKYTAIIMADGTKQEQLHSIRKEYENIYSQLAPFANVQMSYSRNKTDVLNATYTKGSSQSKTETQTITENKGYNNTNTHSTSNGVSQENAGSRVLKGIGGVAMLLGCVTGPAGLGLLGLGMGLNGVAGFLSKTNTNTETSGSSYSEVYSSGTSNSISQQNGTNESRSDSVGMQLGNTDGVMFNVQNKFVIDMLERIDVQLKRIQQFESLGMWECAAYFMSDNPYSAEIAASTYKALMHGENSGVEISAINSWGKGDEYKKKQLEKYIKNFIHPVFCYNRNGQNIEVTPCSFVSGNELALHMGLPRKSVYGLPVIEHANFGKEVVNYDGLKSYQTLNLGKVFNMGSICENKVELDRQSLTMHTFVTGSTGSGKSNTVYELIRQMKNIGTSFMVIEPAKGEYKHVFGNDADVEVFGTNPQYSKLLRINPFIFPSKVHVLEHIDRLVEIFNVCWPMYAAMPAVLKEALLKTYEVCGWDLNTSINCHHVNLYPTFADLQNELVEVIENSAYAQEVKSNYMGSLLTRVKSLTNGLNGQIFSSDEIDNQLLFDRNVIIDLSRVGSLETKSLIMGILIMRLNEHRQTYSDGMNLPLKHITVLEEAHNILKRSEGSINPEGSNVGSKSVEMISNAIAEMRTYGEGFIIVDQSPETLDASAIKNTNTKIIMRLPDESDRRLVGKAANLNDTQIDEIAKLPKGVAVVYQNDWVEPVLCKINKFSNENRVFNYCAPNLQDITNEYCSELFKLLLKGRTVEQLEPNIDLIKDRMVDISLSTKNKLLISSLVEEYCNNNKLEIWEDTNFDKLSNLISELIGSKKIENKIIKSKNFEDLTNVLYDEINAKKIDLSEELKLSICQCLMKEFSKENDENLTIYAAWRKFIVDKGVL